MLTKIIGQAKMTKMMKALQAGPKALFKSAPVKGSGSPIGRSVAPTRPRGYIGKQNPALTPGTGGLIKPKRIK